MSTNVNTPPKIPPIHTITDSTSTSTSTSTIQKSRSGYHHHHPSTTIEPHTESEPEPNQKQKQKQQKQQQEQQQLSFDPTTTINTTTTDTDNTATAALEQRRLKLLSTIEINEWRKRVKLLGLEARRGIDRSEEIGGRRKKAGSVDMEEVDMEVEKKGERWGLEKEEEEEWK